MTTVKDGGFTYSNKMQNTAEVSKEKSDDKSITLQNEFTYMQGINKNDEKGFNNLLRIFDRKLIVVKIYSTKESYKVSVTAPLNPHFLFEENFHLHFINRFEDKVVVGQYANFENFSNLQGSHKMFILKNVFPECYDYFIKNGELCIPNTGSQIEKSMILRKITR